MGRACLCRLQVFSVHRLGDTRPGLTVSQVDLNVSPDVSFLAILEAVPAVCARVLVSLKLLHEGPCAQERMRVFNKPCFWFQVIYDTQDRCDN